MALHALAGSERRPVPGARSIGPADPAEQLEISVVLRQASAEVLREKVRKLAAGDRSETRVEREDFAGQFGALPEDIAEVSTFAATHGLTVTEADPARRTIVLRGTVAAFNDAFGVDLQRFEHAEGAYRGRTGPVHLPDALKDAVEAVLGLDNRPIARSRIRRRPADSTMQPHDGAGAAASFSPAVLASLYGFPPGDGRGTCVAIIELGGGYRIADLQAYFAAMGISPWPDISTVSVDHGMNLPTGDAERTGRRGDARHRGGRRRRPRREDRGVFRAEHRCRIPRRDHHGGARHGEPAVGHLDQLGRAGSQPGRRKR